MAEEKYILTKAESELAISWVNKHLKRCPICGTSDFHLDSAVMEMRSLPYGIIGGTYRFYPAIVVLCKVCAYTMQFNANRMGFARALGVEESSGGK